MGRRERINAVRDGDASEDKLQCSACKVAKSGDYNSRFSDVDIDQTY